jgi:hypothetical protein
MKQKTNINYATSRHLGSQTGEHIKTFEEIMVIFDAQQRSLQRKIDVLFIGLIISLGGLAVINGRSLISNLSRLLNMDKNKNENAIANPNQMGKTEKPIPKRPEDIAEHFCSSINSEQYRLRPLHGKCLQLKERKNDYLKIAKEISNRIKRGKDGARKKSKIIQR